MPAHKDKHMIGTCPDCPDGLEDKPPTLREALEDTIQEIEELVNQFLSGQVIGWSERMRDCAQDTAKQARAALAAPEPDLLGLLKGLTQIGWTPDGGIVIGPRGWELVQEAMTEAEKE